MNVVNQTPLRQVTVEGGVPGAPTFPTTPFAFMWWVTRHVPWRAAAMLGLTVFGHGLQSLAPYAVGKLIDVVNHAQWERMGGWFTLLVVAWFCGPLMTRLYTFANAFTMPKMRVIVDRVLFAHTL